MTTTYGKNRTEDYTGLALDVSQLKVDGIVQPLGNSNQTPVDLTADVTLTAITHANRALTLSAAAGFTSTLPAATGTGNKYKFYVKTTITSNNYVIVAVGSDKIMGVALADDGDGEPANGWSATTATTVTLGGTSNATGGTKGAYVELTDVASALWHAIIFDAQSGTEATPFS